jgi:hypothetical protein
LSSLVGGPFFTTTSSFFVVGTIFLGTSFVAMVLPVSLAVDLLGVLGSSLSSAPFLRVSLTTRLMTVVAIPVAFPESLAPVPALAVTY